MSRLIETLGEIRAAEEQARRFRLQYGPQAEDRCRAALDALEANDPRRARLRDALKALPWITVH